jgi:long-chain fatty acid transport protein
MKISRIAILIALMVGVSAGLFAGGFALSGVGSRAVSMGGAFRGMADDPSAIFWNPAGLAFLTQNEVSLAGTVIVPNTKWQNTAPLPGFAMTEQSADNKIKALPGLFGVYADNKKAVLGLGLYIPYGLGSTWDLYDLPATMPITGHPEGVPVEWSSGFPDKEMSSSVTVLDLHPSLAYKIADNLSFGIGIGVLYGTIDMTQVKPSTTSSYYVPTTFNLSGKGIGVSGNAGIMYKPTDKTSLGFNGRFPTDIAVEGDAEILLWLNNYANFSVWGGTNPAFLVAQTYGGTSEVKADLKLPGELGIGISQQITPEFTINLDYAYTMWERLDKITLTMETPIVILEGHPTMQQTITTTDLVFNWQNTHRVSLGGEYKMCNNAFRAGFFFDQSPVTEATQTPTVSDIGNKLSGNIGYGRTFGNLTIDINGQYVMFPERTITVPTATNMLGVYNSSVISGNLNLGYKF